MTAIEDTLRDVLALMPALRAWVGQYPEQGFMADVDNTLLDAADRLFAQPARDPREQAVLDAARAWHLDDRGRRERASALHAAVEDLYESEQTGPRCEMPSCDKPFVSPEPWIWERSDGQRFAVCHDCHYVLVPR